MWSVLTVLGTFWVRHNSSQTGWTDVGSKLHHRSSSSPFSSSIFILHLSSAPSISSSPPPGLLLLLLLSFGFLIKSPQQNMIIHFSLSLLQQLTGCSGVHSSTNYFTICVNKNQIEHKSVCEEEQQTNRDRSWTFRLWPSADLHLTHTDRSWSILSPLTLCASNCLFVMVWTAEPLTGRLKASSTDSLTVWQL